MSKNGFDPEIVQDFLTEAGELLETLDQDLVSLESSPTDPEMLNKVFRALHTIKGSASFLALTNLVELAHAAESALNAARNSVIVVGREGMDLLLAAVDTLRKQFNDLREGRDLTQAEHKLVAGLTAMGEGRSPSSAPSATPAVVHEQPQVVSHKSTIKTTPAGFEEDQISADTNGPRARPLELASGKLDLLDFFISDVEESITKADALIVALAQTREPDHLNELLGTLAKTAEFFDFAAMTSTIDLLTHTAKGACELDQACFTKTLDLMRDCIGVLREQCAGLKDRKLVERDITNLRDQISALLNAQMWTEPDANVAGHASAMSASTSTRAELVDPPAADEPGPRPAVPVAAASAAPSSPASSEHAPVVEQTIRVEVGRLEALLNLVGELVLQKNRLSAIGRQAVSGSIGLEHLGETLALATGNLDRVTSDIQVAVMRTRMQPLDKLFGRYPRLIRDLARKTSKNIQLVIEGGETEVDKSVIEELADPLVHLLRNSADHGIELPTERAAAGKPEQGTIKLKASHEGSHVLIQIIDDGRGLSRARIGKRAVERGLVTQQQLDQMPDHDVWNFIFAPGFSTAEQVTDLSGRGVGMDVVRTNIAKIKGSVDLSSVEGKGTTISIQIPLTVAILTAMMVQIGTETYAVPLSSIVEIVKPEPGVRGSIRSNPVMRLRDAVLPLLDGCDTFKLPDAKRKETPFALIVEQSDQRVGLMVTRLIGQQEVVIKPLDDMIEHAGPVSGATVRDDGGVSLIVDVGAMLKLAHQARAQARGCVQSEDSSLKKPHAIRTSSCFNKSQAPQSTQT